jgi:hypothetical protein
MNVMSRTLFLLLLFTVLNQTNVYAGWYECYNFEGSIDQYPITLSIQVREGLFGEDAQPKKKFNIIGVYKYDRFNDVIRLEGTVNFKTKKVLLYELDNEKQTATFEFDFSEGTCSGVWTNLLTAKELPLQLNFVSKLRDQSETDVYSKIEILQAKTLKEFYFVGVYSQKGNYRAQMDQLKIVRKKDNSVFQTLDFSKQENLVGNVMTIIYDNIGVPSLDSKEFTVTEDVGKMGDEIVIKFNAKKQLFKIKRAAQE